jgi:hypothetical protein
MVEYGERGTCREWNGGSVKLTLAQWGDVADLAIDAVTTGVAGRPLSEREVEATAELLAGIGGWQEMFAVDGDAAANEWCDIPIPDGLPFAIVAAVDPGAA